MYTMIGSSPKIAITVAVTKPKYLAPIIKLKKSEKSPTPEARYNAYCEKTTYTINPYFVLSWFGILIYMDGLFGDMHTQVLM